MCMMFSFIYPLNYYGTKSGSTLVVWHVWENKIYWNCNSYVLQYKNCQNLNIKTLKRGKKYSFCNVATFITRSNHHHQTIILLIFFVILDTFIAHIANLSLHVINLTKHIACLNRASLWIECRCLLSNWILIHFYEFLNILN